MSEFLYKNRGIITAFLGVLLLVFPPSPFECIGIPFLIAAVFLRIWARMHIGEHSRGSELACPEIVKTGPYKYINHPLYLSNFMAGGALALFHTGFSKETLAFCAIYAIFLTYLAKKENTFLKSCPMSHVPCPKPSFIKDYPTWLWQIAMLILIVLRKHHG
ncbi:MAG: hypothetical protein FWC26_14060 [Fibromonadales bacterium]|nr:hypothetical protein [Fibromonadales bacterium]